MVLTNGRVDDCGIIGVSPSFPLKCPPFVEQVFVYSNDVLLTTHFFLIYIYTYMHAYMHAYMHTCIHTCMHAYMHAHTHTQRHTYIHTYIHT